MLQPAGSGRLSEPRLWRQPRRSETVDASRTPPRRSATRRCCWRAWRRPSWRATASPARKPRRGRRQRHRHGRRLAEWLARQGFHLGRRRRPARHRQCARVSRRTLARAARCAARTAPTRCWWSGGDGARDRAPRRRRCRCSTPACGRTRRHRRTQSGARCSPSPASAIRTSFSQPRPSRDRGRPAPALSRSSPLYRARKRRLLIMRAEHDGLALLTTEKDRARMAGEPLLAALARKTHVLPVTLVVEEADAFAT